MHKLKEKKPKQNHTHQFNITHAQIKKKKPSKLATLARPEVKNQKTTIRVGLKKRIEGNTNLGVDVLSGDRERGIRSHGERSRGQETRARKWGEG